MPSTPLDRTARTRRDVLDAAIEVWALDNTASLGAVAAAAGVGRTTLNRHFPDRAALVAAVDAECRARFGQAVERAELRSGTGWERLRRFCLEVLSLGPVLGLVFADNALVDPDSWVEGEEDDPFALVVVQGHQDGSLATDLPLDWVVTHVWTSLFGAHLISRSDGPLRHEAGQLLVRTLDRGLAG
ncbi:TetR/AcrR family transcriptional regulator [Microlunatus lacustris]